MYERRYTSPLPKLVLAVFIMFCLLAGAFLFLPKSDATGATRIVSVYEGDTLSAVAHELKEKDVIFSSSLFIVYMKFFDFDDKMKPRRYTFTQGEGVFKVAEKLTEGVGEPVSLRLTFPEGSTNEEIASIADSRLINFDKERFLELTRDKEGRLFPDTYFVDRFATEDELIVLLEDTFTEKTTELLAALPGGRTEEEVLIMASIVEEEGKSREDREKIAGVLWKRLNMGMPLQVDAGFLKISETEGRNTYELTDRDLQIDSPYNTYLYVGLPPTPLSNPGVEAIEATLFPEDTPYLYYLSEEDGTTHFTETYEEHLENRERYLE